MSIDLYPALDLDQPETKALGAAALLYKNNGTFWPEFQGSDLHTRNPELRFLNLTEDGATTWDLLNKTDNSFTRAYKEDNVLVSITIGGNDLLQIVRTSNGNGPAKIGTQVSDLIERYKRIVVSVLEEFREPVIILNTIYDPTDGSGELPGYPHFRDKMPFLHYVNDHIRDFAQSNELILADVHQRFLGHGVTAPADDQWYWKPNPIEPSARGASELRRLWWEALQQAGVLK